MMEANFTRSSSLLPGSPASSRTRRWNSSRLSSRFMYRAESSRFVVRDVSVTGSAALSTFGAGALSAFGAAAFAVAVIALVFLVPVFALSTDVILGGERIRSRGKENCEGGTFAEPAFHFDRSEEHTSELQSLRH